MLCFMFFVLMGDIMAAEPDNTVDLSMQNEHGSVLLQTDFRGRVKKIVAMANTSYVPTAFEADYLLDDDNPLMDFTVAMCCEAMTASCLACQQNVTVEQFCTTHTSAIVGCTHDGRVDRRAMATQAPNNGGGGISVGNNAVNVNGIANGTVNCTTREEPRAVAFGYTTSPPGTPCIFGTDDRDEGSHCILDDGKYGSFGWCFTSSDHASWGSCNDKCPLFGQAKILAKKIDSLHEAIHKLGAAKTNTTTTTSTASTRAAPENGTEGGHNMIG